MAASDSPYCSWSNLNLPAAVRPSLYRLHIKSTLRPPYRVTGEVDIDIAASEATPCVVLHSLGINISSVSLQLFKSVAHSKAQQHAVIQGAGLCVRARLRSCVGGERSARGHVCVCLVWACPWTCGVLPHTTKHTRLTP
jgi:hypothetical protein